jgi:hypothetical protein
MISSYRILFAFLGLTTVTFGLIGCDKLSKLGKPIAAAQESSKADGEVLKAFDALSLQVRQGGGKTNSLYYLPDSAKVTINLTNKTAEVDFGTVGLPCPNWDGKTRKGKIKLSWTGAYSDQGTVITMTTENYYVDGEQVIATTTTTNRGRNMQNLIYFTVVAQATVQSSNGTTTWNCNRDQVWIAGSSTLTPYDDKYSITGTANGVIRTGEAYTVNTRLTSPIEVTVGCRKWLTKGILDVSVQGVSDSFEIDYGNGDCISPVKVRYLGQTFTFYI